MWKRIIVFRDKIRGLKRWQKLGLLCIAVAIPAGIIITTILVSGARAKDAQDR